MAKRTRSEIARISSGLWLVTLAVGMVNSAGHAAETKVPVSFSGGHETDPEDRGRPVVLVAAALGVKPEVFREAFSGVTPARDGGPSPEQARRNKQALMKVLRPHGVTNERLDEVSNFYRYRRDRGEFWPTTPAKAHAVIEDGKVKRIEVTEPGAGYSSPPKATLQGLEGVRLETSLRFSKDLKTNGSIGSIKVAPSDAPGTAR